MNEPVETYKCNDCHGKFSRGGVTQFKGFVLCAVCHLKWIRQGKLRCPACKARIANMKKHLRENRDDKHLVLEAMTS